MTFLLKDKQLTMQQAAFIVNSVAKTCKVNDDNWTDVDEMRIKSNIWRGRTFIIGDDYDCMVSIELDDKDGFILCISGFEKFCQTIASI